MGELKPDVAHAALARERQQLVRAMNALRRYFSQLLRVHDERKPRIYAEVSRAAELGELNYWLEIFFSIGIATLGLIINSPAVVIGAMLISPLMGPIIASGLALALGDFYLGTKSLANLILSILVSVALAALITWLLPFRSPTPEILARVQPTLLDLGVAILSGAAGAIVVCRGGGGGGGTALPGVAVAVALVPPIAVVGFGVGIGWDWNIVRGGGLLFLTNLVAIILTSFLVFFSVHMDAPRIRQQIAEWVEENQRHQKLYEFIERSPIRQLLGHVGSLPRRLLILMLFLASVSLPLGRALMQLREETQIRRVVLDQVRSALPRDSVFREDLAIGVERIDLRLIAVLSQENSAEIRHRLEEAIAARTARRVSVTLIDVATNDRLAQLMARPAGAVPTAPVSLEAAQAHIWSVVGPAVRAVWPQQSAPLLAYRLSMESTSSSITLHLAYAAEQDLGQLGAEAVRTALRQRVGSSVLQVQFERIAPDFALVFRPGSSQLTPEARGRLDDLADVLARFTGSTCAVSVPAPAGSRNARLSAARAEAVRKYLAEEKGIPPDRMQAGPGGGCRHVFGQSRPSAFVLRPRGC
jgi:uncharacterized hydrophobic protein (TIGR00271 family)